MSPRPFSILLVCTGNVCRSAYAASLATRLLPETRVSSAGTHAAARGTVPADLVALAAGDGLDLASHRSRQLRREDVVEADLVLGLSREHRSAALRLHPRSSRYAFSLREFTRLAAASTSALGDEARSEAGPRGLVALMSARRGMTRPPLRPADDDIADPMGRGLTAHRRAVAEIAPAITTLASLIDARHLTRLEMDNLT